MIVHAEVDHDLERTAHHESAHAIAALILGYEVVTASIVPDADGRLGHVVAQYRRRWPYRTLCRDAAGRPPYEEDAPLGTDLLVCLAGRAADRRHLGADVPLHAREEAMVSALLQDLPAPVADAVRAAFESQAEQVVTDYWPCIVATAEQLLKRRTLGMRDLCLILAASLRALPPASPSPEDTAMPDDPAPSADDVVHLKDGRTIPLAEFEASVAASASQAGTAVDGVRLADALGKALGAHTQALEKAVAALTAAVERMAASAERPVVLKMKPEFKLSATLQVPKTTRRVVRDPLDRVEKIITEPEP